MRITYRNEMTYANVHEFLMAFISHMSNAAAAFCSYKQKPHWLGLPLTYILHIYYKVVTWEISVMYYSWLGPNKVFTALMIKVLHKSPSCRKGNRLMNPQVGRKKVWGSGIRIDNRPCSLWHLLFKLVLFLNELYNVLFITFLT